MERFVKQRKGSHRGREGLEEGSREGRLTTQPLRLHHSEISDTGLARSCSLISLLRTQLWTSSQLPAQLHSPLHPIPSPKLPVKL